MVFVTQSVIAYLTALTYLRTAKVWKNFNLAYDLKGHQQSVWAVLGVEEDQFLTGKTVNNQPCVCLPHIPIGSADKTIKLWQQHKLIQTFNGHTDAVRGLDLLPDIGFASCANDR